MGRLKTEERWHTWETDVCADGDWRQRRKAILRHSERCVDVVMESKEG